MLCLKWDTETRGAAGGRATKWIQGLGKCPASKSLSCIQFIDRNPAPVSPDQSMGQGESSTCPTPWRGAEPAGRHRDGSSLGPLEQLGGRDAAQRASTACTVQCDSPIPPNPQIQPPPAPASSAVINGRHGGCGRAAVGAAGSQLVPAWPSEPCCCPQGMGPHVRPRAQRGTPTTLESPWVGTQGCQGVPSLGEDKRRHRAKTPTPGVAGAEQV